MGIYKKPEKRVHRGFFYLDDETVINSLSAVEAGKVDEVVSKVNSAREGGFGGGAGAYGIKVEGGKKTASSLEEEIVRTRTRFSIFEIWYQNLLGSKAIGTFSDWGPEALLSVQPGDTVEIRAHLDVAPLQTVYRLYMWFVQQAQKPGTVFSQKGEELKQTKEGERGMRAMMGGADGNAPELVVTARPAGDPGPTVAMQLADEWIIGQVGHLSGEYTFVGQVDHILDTGDELPTLRLTRDAPPTPMEVTTLKDVVKNFIKPAAALGITVTEEDAGIKGPALWLTPIAIYR